ncbi:MAG: protocatechuate 3,4-dioxygenase subunit alpha [Nocardioides sp.]
MTATPLTPTPGQTVGPFFHYALPYDGDRDLVPAGTPGAVRLHGTVYDGAGAGVPDALVEIWQADQQGRVVQRQGSMRRDGHTFTGFGRASTDRTGEYTFTTLTPQGVDGGLPFFAVTVFARGLLNRLFTRAYLPLAAGASDPLLDSVRPDRRATLVCEPDGHGFRFDIRLMGEGETVFLRYPGH